MDWSHFLQASRQYYTQTLTWNPRGKGKEDDCETPWRRDLEADFKEIGHSLRQLRDIGSGLEWLAESCWRLMPRMGNDSFD